MNRDAHVSFWYGITRYVEYIFDFDGPELNMSTNFCLLINEKMFNVTKSDNFKETCPFITYDSVSQYVIF